MSEAYEDESRNQLMEMTKMLGALISSLQRSMGSGHGLNGNGYGSNGNGHSRRDEDDIPTEVSFDRSYIPED